MKFILFNFAMLLSLLASATNIPGSDGRIQGKVCDKNSHRVLEFTSIVLYNAEDSTIVSGSMTDSTGTFLIANLPYGKYFIEADFIGYSKNIVQKIELSRDNKELSIGTIELDPAGIVLDEHTVSADRNYVDFKIDRKVINVSQHINAQGGSASDVLENAPSVTVDMDGNVLLRGSSDFKVLIDGKPSVLQGNDALKQIPASLIENIEIITNPSAKFDPDGTTGIINIVLKKEKTDGISGILNVTAGTGQKYGGDFMMSIRRGKVNGFIGADYNWNKHTAHATNQRTSDYTDTTDFLFEDQRRIRIFNPWKIQGGIDFLPNKSNTITISGNTGSFGMIRRFYTLYDEWTEPNTNNLYSYTDDYFDVLGQYYTGTFSFQHRFNKEGQNLDFSASAWRWEGINKEEVLSGFTNSSYLITGLRSMSRNEHKSIRDNVLIKADYSLPVKNGKIEAGLQAHLNPGESQFNLDDYNPATKKWEVNNQFSNSMYFKRNLYSGYLTYASEFHGFSYQLGLRGEYTDRLLHQKTTGEKYPLSLANLYPTVHVSRKLNEKNQIQVSYTRRINRPEAYELNPFPNMSDSYNYFEGNPMLLPEDIDSYELNYQLRLKRGFLASGIYYRNSKNMKTMAMTIDENNIMYIRYENLNKAEATGAESSLNYDVSKWMNINLTGNVYYYSINGTNNESNYERQSFNLDGNAAVSFKIKNHTRIQLTGYYNSPTVDGFGRREALWAFGAGIRHNLLDGKASFSLNIRDIFGTQTYEIITTEPNYTSHFIHNGEYFVIRGSFSYKINNYQQRKQVQGVTFGDGL